MQEHVRLICYLMAMKKEFDLRITKDGTIEGVYQDGLAETLSAEQAEVCRASHVEYEDIDGRKGWTVRSAVDPELAIRATDWCRVGVAKEGTIITYLTREAALAAELVFFWQLLGKDVK